MHPLLRLLSEVRAIARTCGVPTALAFLRGVTASAPEILRSGTLVSADRAMAGASWPFSLQGVRFELDGRYFSGAREMYCRQVYFPRADFGLRAGEIVVDLGANAGLFSVLAAIAGCKVLAVEAQHGFVRELRALAACYGVGDRIVVECALVGAASGVLSNRAKLEAASHFEGVVPPVVSMDTLLGRHGIDRVDFLKVDIEGSEFDLFLSAAPWLRVVRKIAMEVHSGFGSIPDLVEAISAHGFRIERRNNDLQVVNAISGPTGYLFAIRDIGNG